MIIETYGLLGQLLKHAWKDLNYNINKNDFERILINKDYVFNIETFKNESFGIVEIYKYGNKITTLHIDKKMNEVDFVKEAKEFISDWIYGLI